MIIFRMAIFYASFYIIVPSATWEMFSILEVEKMFLLINVI